MTALAQWSELPSTPTVSLPVKRALPKYMPTPSLRNRSAESWRLMSPRTEHLLHDGGEVHERFALGYNSAFPRAGPPRRRARRQQCRWDTTSNETVATHEVTLDQCDLRAQSCRARGTDQPAVPAPSPRVISSPALIDRSAGACFGRAGVVLVHRWNVDGPIHSGATIRSASARRARRVTYIVTAIVAQRPSA